MALANQQDVEARLGRPTTAEEQLRLPSLLDDASAVVIGYCRDDFQTPVHSATVDAATDAVDTAAEQTRVVGDRVTFTSLTGGAGLAVGTLYVVNAVLSSTSFTLSATAGGATIDVTTDATAATFTVCPAAVVGVVAKMVARSLERGAGVGSVVEQENAGALGIRYSAVASSGDMWLTAADKLALRPHRRGLTSVGLVGARYEITED